MYGLGLWNSVGIIKCTTALSIALSNTALCVTIWTESFWEPGECCELDMKHLPKEWTCWKFILDCLHQLAIPPAMEECSSFFTSSQTCGLILAIGIRCNKWRGTTWQVGWQTQGLVQSIDFLQMVRIWNFVLFWCNKRISSQLECFQEK